MKKAFHLFGVIIQKIVRTDILFTDIVEITVQRIRIKKLRAFLTILGIGVGISVVYFLVSLTFGLQKLVIGRIANSESLLSLDVVPNTEINQFVKLDSKVMDNISKISLVEQVSTVKSLAAEIKYNDLKTQSLAYGVNSNYFRLSGINPSSGALLSEKNPDGLVVSSAILSLFNMDSQKILGTKVYLSLLQSDDPQATISGMLAPKVIEIPKQFTIVGVVDDESNYFYVNQEAFSVANLDEFKSAKVKVTSREAVDPVRNEIIAKGFLVTAMTDTLEQINNIFKITQITFTVVGIVALFVAAIGMLNTMTVSLLERTREIGIMKSIGATEKGISQMFLMESIIMGLGGGLGGLVLGFVLSKIVGLIVNLLAMSFGGQSVNIFYTPPWFILLVLGFSLMIGLITGIFPARRASRLNPLDALRYE